jgi:hypothetical protein
VHRCGGRLGRGGARHLDREEKPGVCLPAGAPNRAYLVLQTVRELLCRTIGQKVLLIFQMRAET